MLCPHCPHCHKDTEPKIELLPCPFCGSTNVRLYDYAGDESVSRGESYVFCLNCKAKGPNVEGYYHGGIGPWNMRKIG